MFLEGAAASEWAVFAGKSSERDSRPLARGRIDIGINLCKHPAAERLDGRANAVNLRDRVLVAAVACGWGAVRLDVVGGLQSDHDEVGIQLRRNEILRVFIPIPQAKCGIMVEVDALAFGKA